MEKCISIKKCNQTTFKLLQTRGRELVRVKHSVSKYITSLIVD